MTATAVAATVELRCHRCSMFLAPATDEMRLVAIFRKDVYGVVPRAHPAEVSRRCRACGWINVFHPLTVQRHLGSVETKS